RRKYDELRGQYREWQERGGREDFNWGQWQKPPGQRGSYAYNVSPEDLQDIFGADSPFSDFFSSIFGETGAGPGRGERKPRPRRGQEVEARAEVTLDEAFRGTTRSIQLGDRRIEARIPPGVRRGSRIRLAGQGSPGVGGGPSGDLFLEVDVAPDARFEREGDDLRTVIPVDFYTAAVGGEVRVPTMDGAVMLKVPPRTQADRSFRLRGKGMPRVGRPHERGDMTARVKIVLPETMSDSEQEALRKLAEARGTAKATVS
ncbi:MAG: DnaJ C-terminal domain-containing protein, partial [Vicinamibacteria bacterium]